MPGLAMRDSTTFAAVVARSGFARPLKSDRSVSAFNLLPQSAMLQLACLWPWWAQDDPSCTKLR